MKIRVPEYFKDFKCIADKCKDSCCIGWEIDVDDDAKAKYEAMNTALGSEIIEKTSHGYFPLQENGRCVFLKENGLCRIICEAGEEYLCDICREHPRYYNVSAGATEGGIGLGCEEAARIITQLRELPKLVEVEHTAPLLEEEGFSELTARIRDELFSLIFSENVNDIAKLYLKYAALGDQMAFDMITSSEVKAELPTLTVGGVSSDEIREKYLSMLELFKECEALDEDLWSRYIEDISRIGVQEILTTLNAHRGLLYYFTHRYVVGGIEDMTIGERILFALIAPMTVAALSMTDSFNTKNGSPIIEAAVAFSKNIEYSNENIDFIFSAEM